MTRVQANLLLLLAGAMWGMGFVAQSTAMDAIGPFLFIGLRFAIACLSVLPFALWESRRSTASLTVLDKRNFVVIGVLLFAGMAAQQVGLLTTTVTNSGFLTGLYVVMVPFLAVLLFRQWPHRIVWPAALSALAGIWLLSGAGKVSLQIGDWLTILCALFWAIQVIMIGRSASHTGRPVTLSVTQFGVTAVIALAIASFIEPIDLAAIRIALPEILYAGVFSGGIAFTLQVIGQRYTTAPQAAIFLSTEAVFAALFGAIFLGERLPPLGLAGCGLIFAAILAVEIAPAIRSRRRSVA
ncbi:DMT family transporter [Nitratireductor aquimarinus]|uniref:DMT family transporter n=1 Tax=Nitratireductor aquimarinus TaxID=889300 RepID=UPI001A903DA1|nr:DMT family transporter [Nitratireductor aquimarinus]MBN8242715.1 DMT family transporter [Nitratireductor aquimarinus]MBY6131815.1 DMT family transporter [Nitratireductor aquimarinus]MCA1301352.1 DMT family transporter [Nitratireductor aquimarinus]